jgi:hypothetical protein
MMDCKKCRNSIYGQPGGKDCYKCLKKHDEMIESTKGCFDVIAESLEALPVKDVDRNCGLDSLVILRTCVSNLEKQNAELVSICVKAMQLIVDNKLSFDGQTDFDRVRNISTGGE